MDDKCIMENMLLTAKGMCDLYMHGAVESATTNVNSTFKNALNDTLAMQDNIYKQMAQKGWYPPEQATPEQLQKVKNKFAAANSSK